MRDKNREISIDSFWRFIKYHSELCYSDVLPTMTRRKEWKEGTIFLVHGFTGFNS